MQQWVSFERFGSSRSFGYTPQVDFGNSVRHADGCLRAMRCGCACTVKLGSMPYNSDIRDTNLSVSDVRKQARERAVARFSNELVAEQYLTIYNQLIF